MRMTFRDSVPGQLLRVWTCPRLLGWTLLCAAVMTAARLPFLAWPTIPNYVGFNPGIVLVPLAGSFWGPVGAWAALAASLAGDAFAGLWGELTPYRAAGQFLYALSAQQLWELRPFDVDGGPVHLPRWGHALRFLAVAWPGALIAAAWPAVGSERHELYPFPYFFSVLTVHHLLFVTVLGVASYRVIARELVPHARDWRGLLGVRPAPRRVGALRAAAVLVSAIGAPLAGLAVAGGCYRIHLFEPYVLGTGCGALVPLVVLPLLLVQPLALLPWLRRGGGARGDPPGGGPEGTRPGDEAAPAAAREVWTGLRRI